MTDYAGNPFFCDCLFGGAAYREEMIVRRFYGDATYEAIRKWEADERRFAAMKRATAPDRIDDVADQIKGLT